MKVETLLVLPFFARQEGEPLGGVMLFTISLLRRNAIAGERAGIGRVLVAADDPEHARRLLGRSTSAEILSREDPLPACERIIVLADGVLASPERLKTLRSAPLPDASVRRDAQGLAAAAPGAAVAGLRTQDAFALLDDEGGTPLAVAGEEFFRLAVPGDRDAAQSWLLRRLIKPGDSPLTRLIDRPISLAITRRLAATRVTPNHVTAFSLLCGVSAAPFFLSLRPGVQTAGAGLLLLHNILDGCDGELARLKHQTSRAGMILDMWGDNVVHAALFACMGLGWSRSAGALWPLGLAALAIAGTLATACMVYLKTLRGADDADRADTRGSAASASRDESRGAAPEFTGIVDDRNTPLSRWVNALANRDFLYAVFVMSWFGAAQWLLPAVALGSPLYFAALIALGRRPENA